MTIVTKEQFMELFKANNHKDFITPSAWDEDSNLTEYFANFKSAFFHVYFDKPLYKTTTPPQLSVDMLLKCAPFILSLDTKELFFVQILELTCTYEDHKPFNFALNYFQRHVPYYFLEMSMNFLMDIAIKSSRACFRVFYIHFTGLKVNNRVEAWVMDGVEQYKFVPYGSFLQTLLVACITAKLYDKLEDITEYIHTVTKENPKNIPKALPLDMIKEMENKQNIWYLHQAIANNYEELMIHAQKCTKMWISYLSEKQSSFSPILQSRIDGWKLYTDKIKSINTVTTQDLYKYEIIPFLINNN
jgi:hypothetical protein